VGTERRIDPRHRAEMLAAWSRRSTSAIRVGSPAAWNAAFDIVVAASHSRTITFQAGRWWSTLAPTPASPAAIVFASSLPRSIASRSVPTPGIRTKCDVPSTVTRKFRLVSPPEIGATSMPAPARASAQDGIAAMTSSIDGSTTAGLPAVTGAERT